MTARFLLGLVVGALLVLAVAADAQLVPPPPKPDMQGQLVIMTIEEAARIGQALDDAAARIRDLEARVEKLRGRKDCA